MDLLTVTCSHDKLQMLLQAESIQKFLSPCTHWVVIDDSVISTEEWLTLLSPYYTKHKLIIVDGFKINSNFDDKGGWVRQQYHKFAAFEYIKNDYLILDSKNFFIRETNINEWDSTIGNGSQTNFFNNHSWDATIIEYAKYFDIPVNFQHLSILTPFVFHKSVLDNIKDYPKFLDYFINQPVIPSEFLLYSTLLYKLDKFPKIFEKNTKFHLLTHNFNLKADQLLSYFFDKEHVKVAGTHRSLLYQFDSKDQSCFSAWLNKKGLYVNVFGEKFHI